MLRIFAAALVLTMALPNSQALCETWCATQAAETCQHADTAGRALLASAHQCGANLASAPGVNERLSATRAIGLPLSPFLSVQPLGVLTALADATRSFDTQPHAPLRAVLRI